MKQLSFVKQMFGGKGHSKGDLSKLVNNIQMGSFGSWSPGPPTFEKDGGKACQFTEEYQKVFLKSKLQISTDTYVFTFTTPDGETPLNLPTCACILARMKDSEGNEIVRPYTPCSPNSMPGEFQLMVKIYPDGKMTQILKDLKNSAQVEFKHVPFNVKIQYPFGKKFIGMIVGGTGITPMIQALHALLGTKTDTTQVGMLYGSRTSENILGKDTLDTWVKGTKRLQVTHVLSNEPDDSKWEGERGFVTKELIEKHFAAPSNDTLIFVCGPPPMYQAICGPRDEKEVTGILGELGYSAEQVYKF